MAKIEDYGVIGDCQSMALVSKEGSIDWLCLPRFDSGACFTKLLGNSQNGYWSLKPSRILKISRKYIESTLVLETRFLTEDGEVSVTDFMPPRGEAPDVCRIVRGLRGEVEMQCDIALRFDYGAFVPWVRKEKDGILAIAGPDTIHLYSPIEMRWKDGACRERFSIKEGQTLEFSMTWYPSHHPRPKHLDSQSELRTTLKWWKDWSAKSTYRGEWKAAVERSLITLKALTYHPTGGIVAAGTTSLPENIRGTRNWDYRYCWLRDATFTLYSLMCAGYVDEAQAWRDWLLRATAGEPAQMQIMYGVAGERRLTEINLPWLAGYEQSKPVRVGNAAHTQVQLDVYGELMDVFHVARRSGLKPSHDDWNLQLQLMNFLEGHWKKPDEGIWEVRGPKRHFTHSKIMAWVAMDRAVKAVQNFGLQGPVERWKKNREEIHKEVCSRGFNRKKNCFVQYYGGEDLDAALLLIPMVGFLPASDPRVINTVAAIEKNLLVDGFIQRYSPQKGLDGLPEEEGAFLACSFWFVDNLYMQGREKEARAFFERLLRLRNDLGLLSEEYDSKSKRLIGNFPQAFSHVALINSAFNLSEAASPALERSEVTVSLDAVGEA